MKNIEDINREAVKKITSNKKITNFDDKNCCNLTNCSYVLSIIT